MPPATPHTPISDEPDVQGNSGSWTGDRDRVAAIALGVCLAIGAVVLFVVATAGLHG